LSIIFYQLLFFCQAPNAEKSVGTATVGAAGCSFSQSQTKRLHNVLRRLKLWLLTERSATGKAFQVRGTAKVEDLATSPWSAVFLEFKLLVGFDVKRS